MTTPSIDNPEFVERDGYTGLIVDETGTIAAREYHTEHQTADGIKQRAFVSTVTDEAYRGKGLAGKIVQYTLDKALADGYRLVAICTYVKSWIEKQDDSRYRDAQDPARPAHFPKGQAHD